MQPYRRQLNEHNYAGSMSAASSAASSVSSSGSGFSSAAVPIAFSTLRSMMAAPHCHFAAAADFKNTSIVFTQHFDQTFDLAFNTGHLDHQRFRSKVDDAGTEHLDEVKDLGTVARRGSHLDQREFTRHIGSLGDIVHVDNVLEFEEAGANTMPGFLRASQTSVRRDSPGRSLRPTVSELMLMFNRRNNDATRVNTPGKSST